MKRISLRAFVRARRPAPLSALALTLACLSALAAFGLTGAPAAAAQENFQGQWLADYKIHGGKGDGAALQTNLSLRYREERAGKDGRTRFNNMDYTRWVEHARLKGLTREQAFSAGGTQVRFQLRRDAGTFDCEGWFKDGRGSGHFTFRPSAEFAAELQRRGVGTPDSRQLLSLAFSDTGLALLDELNSQGYERPDVERLVRLGDHGVRLEYVRGLRAEGYRLTSLEALQRMRDHGVTLEFIRELRDLGFRDLTAEELVRTRDHGVTGSFIRELEAAGYKAPDSLAGLIRLRDHGVTPGFIRELRAEGYAALPLDALVRLKDHGVTTAFIRELKALGYANLAVEQLVRLRDHGVTASFIRRVKSERSDSPAVEELIRLKNRGEYD